MATQIQGDSGGSNSVATVAIVVVLILVVLGVIWFIVYGNRMSGPTSGTNINIPPINVNLNTNSGNPPTNRGSSGATSNTNGTQ